MAEEKHLMVIRLRVNVTHELCRSITSGAKLRRFTYLSERNLNWPCLLLNLCPNRRT